MKNKGLIIIGITVALAIGAIVFLTTRNIQFAQKEFTSDGYIIAPAESEEGESTTNKQYFFNEGDIYLAKKDDTIAFKTVEGDNATVGKDNFIHYTDTSMTSMAKSVILDADSIHENQIVYYTLAKGSEVEKRNQGYAVYNGDELLNLQNFIWKLSANRYMLVSPEIELVVDEDSSQKFDDFIQIDYKDGGVVDLVNQDGTYRTISSDAYLEMTNGVRVYLGSKNISDSKGILMNMGQMLVNSSDDVELSPDIAFTNESDDQPRITVEATDGRDGADGEDGAEGKAGQAGQAGQAGESGESGENGENGENGEKGAQGAAGSGGGGGTGGTPGNDAKNAGITFAEEEMPVFSIVDKMDISTTGVSAKMKFDEDKCPVDPENTYITIVESATGEEIWRYKPGKDKLISSGFDVKCDGLLRPDTNYTMAVTATYTPESTGQPVTSTVLTKYFTTLAEGLSLSVKYASETYIVADLAKTSDSTIKEIYVEIKDSDMKRLAYTRFGMPTDEDIKQQYYDPSIGSIKVEQMDVGDHYELVFRPLDRNTLYYLHIYDKEQTELMNEYFPYVKAKTLKTPPTLERPRVDLIERDNAFVITPEGIQDPDSGIVSYTYEIYRTIDVDMSGKNPAFLEKPVYTSQKSTPVDLSVPIDGTRIKRITDDPNAKYVCRILANFDNNETMVVYSSPLSNEFFAGQSAWPTVLNKLDEDYVTASTAQGMIIIDDPNHTITISDAFRVKLTCKASGDIDTRELIIPVSYEDLEKGYRDEKGHYELPYFLSGLKDNNQYTIYATADYLTVEGEVHSNVLIGSGAFNTKGPDKHGRSIEKGGYDPLLVKYAVNTSDTTKAVSVYVGFTSFLSKEEEDIRREMKTNALSSKQGLENLGDFTGKSFGYVEFSLWGSDAEGKEPVEQLGVFRDWDDGAKSANEGFNFGKNENSMYNRYYTSTLSEPYYSSPSECNCVYLTEDSFNVTTDKAKQYKKLFIKAVAYDYCYGDGGREKRTFGDNNFIQIGNTTEYVPGSDKDPYIELEPKATLPGIPPEKDFVSEKIERQYASAKINEDEYLDRVAKNIEARTAARDFPQDPSKGIEYVTYLSNINSNSYDTQAELEAVWDDVKGKTLAGYKIEGYKNFSDYGDAIKYTIYKDENLTEEVTTSGWIKYNKEITKECPTWSFFFDIPDFVTGKSISRGEPFWVKTEINLNPGFGGKSIFPTEFAGPGEEYPFDEGTVIMKKLVGYKQIPDVYMAQKDAVNTATGSYGSYYFEYDDKDNALLYKNNNPSWENILFYIAADLYDSEIASPSSVNITESGMTGETARDPMRYLIRDLALNKKFDEGAVGRVRSLFVKYDLNPTDEEDEESKKLIQLVNDEKAIPRRTSFFHTFLNEFEDSSVRSAIDSQWRSQKIDGSGVGYQPATVSEDKDSGKVNFRFRFFTDNVIQDNIEEICGPLSFYLYDVDEHGNPTGEIKCRKENIKKGGSDGYRINYIGWMCDQVYAYEAVVSVDVADLYRFASTQYFYCKAFWSYDSGSYGTDYVKEYSIDPEKTDSESKGGYALQRNTSASYVDYTLEDSIVMPATSSDLVIFRAREDDSWKSLIESRNVAFADMGNIRGLPAEADIAAFGLNYIPREVAVKNIGVKLHLSDVLPVVTGTIVRGLNSAKISLNVSKNNTLASPSEPNLRLYYRKHSDDPEHPGPWCEYPLEWRVTPNEDVSLDPETILGLEMATWYDVRIDALMERPDSAAQWVELTVADGKKASNLEKFQTLSNAGMDIDDFVFVAPNTGREDKYVYIPTRIESILLSDLENSVESVVVDITTYDETAPDNIRVLGQKEYSREKLLKMFHDQNPGADVGNIVIETELDWSPLPDTGGQADGHIMNGIENEEVSGRNYTARMHLNYTTGASDEKTKSKRGKSWIGKGSYQIVRASYVSVEGDSSVVKIRANVTADDQRRVFEVIPATASEHPITVEATLKLYEVDNNGNLMMPEGFNDDSRTKKTYMQYHPAGDKPGTLDPSETIVWDGVKAGRKYVVLSSIGADFDNDASYEEYPAYSGYIVTPDPDKGAYIAYITLEPRTSFGIAHLYGSRLGPVNVKKIVYHIYTTGTSEEIDKTVTLTGSDITQYYHPQGLTEGYYILDIPGELMNNPSYNYVLDVSLYTNEGDTVPVTKNTGTYTAPSPVSRAVSMIRSIFR